MWKQLGYPKFGGYETDPVEVREAIRSQDNIHDEHTPTYLSPGMETKLLKNRIGLELYQ